MTSDIHCQEEYIYYHDVHMHVDIYQPRYFKGTIIILHGLIANGRMLSFLAGKYLFDGIGFVRHVGVSIGGTLSANSRCHRDSFVGSQ